MITVNQTGININHSLCVFHALSTDTKPVVSYTDPNTSTKTYIANGSKLYEIDTSKTYTYDAENNLWKENSR